MRTHLLRTFYPSPAAEADTGLAANDEQYEGPVAARPLTLAASAEPTPRSREDEYELGGYAGI